MARYNTVARSLVTVICLGGTLVLTPSGAFAAARNLQTQGMKAQLMADARLSFGARGGEARGIGLVRIDTGRGGGPNK